MGAEKDVGEPGTFRVQSQLSQSVHRPAHPRPAHAGIGHSRWAFPPPRTSVRWRFQTRCTLRWKCDTRVLARRNPSAVGLRATNQRKIRLTHSQKPSLSSQSMSWENHGRKRWELVPKYAQRQGHSHMEKATRDLSRCGIGDLRRFGSFERPIAIVGATSR